MTLEEEKLISGPYSRETREAAKETLEAIVRKV